MAITLDDVRLGEIYYGYLLELARTSPGATVRYGALVERAKAEYPDDEIVQGAITTNIGRRLDLVNAFCRKHELPDLGCLAVNATDKPANTYDKFLQWEEEKAKVAAFDWASVDLLWQAHVTAERKSATPLVKRPREEAEKLLRMHWVGRNNQTPPKYPARIDNTQKELILRALQRGVDPDSAFDDVLFPSV
jgi:hypothetical protein